MLALTNVNILTLLMELLRSIVDLSYNEMNVYNYTIIIMKLL
jgi:hypothetical protein